MMNRYFGVKLTAIWVLILTSTAAYSQIGGTRTFRFLDVAPSARAAGNGGSTMPLWGDDINLLYSNPAALNPGMQKQVPLNFCNYVGDLKYYNVAYAHSLKQHGMAALSLQAFNYGEFQGYDQTGVETTKFKASDYTFGLHYARSLADSTFNIGIACKTIISAYETYQTMGEAVDIGILYHTKNELVISLLAKNIGFMLSPYYPKSGYGRESLPNTVQVGLSKQVKKAPFRIFAVYDQLLKWNVNYVSPIDTSGRSTSFGSTTAIDSTGFQRFLKRAGSATDQFFRHVTLGTEIQLSKNFHLRIAYNYRRQQEFSLTEKRGAAALSFGFNIKLKSFCFAYSYGKMAVPGNSHLLGLTFCW